MSECCICLSCAQVAHCVHYKVNRSIHAQIINIFRKIAPHMCIYLARKIKWIVHTQLKNISCSFNKYQYEYSSSQIVTRLYYRHFSGPYAATTNTARPIDFSCGGHDSMNLRFQLW